MWNRIGNHKLVEEEQLEEGRMSGVIVNRGERDAVIEREERRAKMSVLRRIGSNTPRTA